MDVNVVKHTIACIRTGHFRLTSVLSKQFEKSEPGLFVSVTSFFDSSSAYWLAKLAPRS